MTTGVTRRELLVSKGWIQAVGLVVLCGFAVLGLLAYRTYTAEPPIAARTVGADGAVLFTRADVDAGQQVFLRAGLMEYGSIFGHGAYLGPDFTADYLHRAAELALRTYGGSDQARQQVINDFQTNRYDPTTDTLTLSGAQAAAYGQATDAQKHFEDLWNSSDVSDHQPGGHSPVDVVFRVVGLGGFRAPPG